MTSRLSQEQFKNQVSSFKFQESRIKNNQDQDSRLKIQESRKDSIKISTKMFFKTMCHEVFTKAFTKEFYSLVNDYQFTVIDYQ